MVKYAIDVSRWNGYTEDYFKSHKKHGVAFVFVQLTYGVGTPNPYRKNQIYNAKKVIGSNRVGAYHFLTQNSNALNEAKEFIAYLKSEGFNKDTPIMIDSEADKFNTTEAINTFSTQLAKNGYTRILVYSMAYYFNSNIIKREKLKYNNLWVANYGGSKPAVNSPKLWQYTETGLLNTDYNVIYDFNFLVPNKPTKFLKSGSLFKVKADKVLEYASKSFKDKTGVRYNHNSIIKAYPVKLNSIYRLKTPGGYITANSQFIKKIK